MDASDIINLLAVFYKVQLIYAKREFNGIANKGILEVG